jgi:hypothetical protein
VLSKALGVYAEGFLALGVGKRGNACLTMTYQVFDINIFLPLCVLFRYTIDVPDDTFSLEGCFMALHCFSETLFNKLFSKDASPLLVQRDAA